jgi:hypothetical protein
MRSTARRRVAGKGREEKGEKEDNWTRGRERGVNGEGDDTSRRREEEKRTCVR